MADRKYLWFAAAIGLANVPSCVPQVCETPQGVCHQFDKHDELTINWRPNPSTERVVLWDAIGEQPSRIVLTTQERPFKLALSPHINGWENTTDITRQRGRDSVKGFLGTRVSHHLELQQCFKDGCHPKQLIFSMPAHFMEQLARRSH